MSKKIVALIFAVMLGAVITSCALMSNAVAAAPLRLRIVVHEHQFFNGDTSCYAQHLKEHLYARKLDDTLIARGRTLFSINAVSALDKVIIGIDYWGLDATLAEIAELSSQALRKPASDAMIEQEKRLVDYEERLLATNPRLGASVTNELLVAAGLPLPSSCPLDELNSLIGEDPEEVRPRTDIYEYTASGEYLLLSSSALQGREFPNVWDTVSPINKGETVQTRQDGSQALFVSYLGDANASASATLLATIYELTKLGEYPNLSNRPFGKSGFLIFGNSGELQRVREQLHSKELQKNATAEIIEAAAQAWTYVCSPKGVTESGGSPIVNELIADTYFEFSELDPYCDSQPSTGPVAFENPLLTKLVTLPDTNSNAPTLVPSQKFELCIVASQSWQDELSIASFALRQSLRLDLGLALNVQYSETKDGCVTGSIFAPKENLEAIRYHLRKVNFERPPLVGRLASGAAFYFCSNGYVEECEEVLDEEQFLLSHDTEIELN